MPQGLEEIKELSGKIGKGFDKGLMSSVLENNSKMINQGKLINESINQGIGTFNPDIMFEEIVKNFSIAKKIYGPKLIRDLTGYNSDYIERNVKIPEFTRELKNGMEEMFEKFKEEGIVDKEGHLNKKGIELASLVNCVEELDHLLPKGIIGEKIHKKIDIYGEKQDVRNYKRGHRYSDIAIRKSIRKAVRRGHGSLDETDLTVFNRRSKGRLSVIYGLDASGSMKGEKIAACKRAGIALAYKAIDENDMVGIIVFGSEIKKEIRPTDDFPLLLREITQIRASRQTDIAKTINKAVELFSGEDCTKHLMLITDALPTTGKEPEKETLDAAATAKDSGITISLVGIKLDKKGEGLARKIVDLGEGRFYIVKNLKDIDVLVLEDYHSFI